MEGLMLNEKKNKTFIQFFVETKAQQNTGEGKVEEDTASKVIRERAVQEIAPVIMFSWRHPKGVYIKTLNLETGDAPTLAREAYEIIKERKSELTMRFVSTDSCPKMKGKYAGTRHKWPKIT